MANHPQQVDETFQFIELITVFQKPHALPRIAPALLIADRFKQTGRDLEDEFFAIVGVRQVHRIVGVDQQQLAGGEVMLLAVAAPQAIAAQQHLQVINAVQRTGRNAHTGAVADAAQVEAGELAMIETGQWLARTGHEDAMVADVLIDVARHRVRVGMVEHPATLTQQLRLHHQVTLVVVIGCVGSFQNSARIDVLSQDLVGASLLAMTECQSTWMLNVKPLSRASSLPQCGDPTGSCDQSSSARTRSWRCCSSGWAEDCRVKSNSISAKRPLTPWAAARC